MAPSFEYCLNISSGSKTTSPDLPVAFPGVNS